MKYSLRALIVIVFCTAISCSPSKKEIRDEFTKSCIQEADKQTDDPNVRKAVHDYCKCAGEMTSEKLSVTDWTEIDNLKKKGESAAIKAKLMPILQPCEEEMRRKMMADDTTASH